jgi:tRNA(Ile)-lysidine synthase TilS/MesJ
MLLDMFLRYRTENGLNNNFKVFSAPFPKHMYYNDQGHELTNFIEIKLYWQSRGVDIEYRTPDFEDISDDDVYGCKICKKARKTEIDKFLTALELPIGVLTGFTMYDSLAYINMLLMTCNYDLTNLDNLPKDTKKMMTKMFHKMSLREHLPNGLYFIRPILPFNEVEVHEYLKAKKIPYLTTPCNIMKFKFKRLHGKALDVYEYLSATYEGIERFLLANGIQLNNNELSFDDVEDENYFIDC